MEKWLMASLGDRLGSVGGAVLPMAHGEVLTLEDRNSSLLCDSHKDRHGLCDCYSSHKEMKTVHGCYSRGTLISARILISAADFGGKK
jgi:hypothetical protein